MEGTVTFAELKDFLVKDFLVHTVFDISFI